MSDIVERLRAPLKAYASLYSREEMNHDAADEITRLRADFEKAKEALRPISRFATVIDETEKAWGYEPSPDGKVINGKLTVGHFRRAASTLKEIEHEAR